MKPAPDGSAAAWLFRGNADWWDLARYGPPGFEAYVRIDFEPGTGGAEDAAGHDAVQDGGAGYDAVAQALAVLAAHTGSTTGYAAVGEGWGGRGPAPIAPVVDIPNRRMLLFAGMIDELRFAPAAAWRESGGSFVPPHLAWPADRAWCLACEVDEDIAFSVGCTAAAARALADALRGRVRRVSYGASEPLYADER